MPKTRKFRELYDKMAPAARADIERRVQESLREMPFHELRAARRLTQEQLADTLGLTQGAVSQVEHQTDLYLSTLRKFVEAMGGQLEIWAEVPDGRIRLTEIGESRAAGQDDAVRRDVAW